MRHAILLAAALAAFAAPLLAEDATVVELAGGAKATLPGSWKLKADGASVLASQEGKDALVLFLHASSRSGKSLAEIAEGAVTRFEGGRKREKSTWPETRSGKTRAGVTYAAQGSSSRGEKGELHQRLWALQSGEGFRIVLVCATTAELFEKVLADATSAVEGLTIPGVAPPAPAAPVAPAAPRQRIFDATFAMGPHWTPVKAEGLARPAYKTAVSYLPQWNPKVYQMTIKSDGATDAKRHDERKEGGDDRFEPNDVPAQAAQLPRGYKGILVSGDNDYFTLPEGTHEVELTYAYDPPITFPQIITFSATGSSEHHGGYNCVATHTITVKKGERGLFCVAGSGVHHERLAYPVPIAADVHVGEVQDLEGALKTWLLDGAELGLARSQKAELKVAWRNEGKSEAGPFVQLLVFEVEPSGWVSERYGIAVGSPRGAFFAGTGLPGSAPASVRDEVFEKRVTKELAAVCASLEHDEKAPTRREDLEKWLVKKGKYSWSSSSHAADKNNFTGQTFYANFYFSVEWLFHADRTAERKSKESGGATGYDNSPSGGGRSTGGAYLTGGDKGDGKMPFEVWEVGGKTWLAVKQRGGIHGFHALEIAEKRFAIDGQAE